VKQRPLLYIETSPVGASQPVEQRRRVSANRDEVGRLATVYPRERVIPERFAEDAEHIAYATVCKADVLVSLNLRHLANEWAERRVCAVNRREGYRQLSIRTPEEVLEHED
jgi:hypothetical protein